MRDCQGMWRLFRQIAARKIPEIFKSRFISGARPNAISYVHSLNNFSARHITYTCSLTLNWPANSQRTSSVTAVCTASQFSVSWALDKRNDEYISLCEKGKDHGSPKCLYSIGHAISEWRPNPESDATRLSLTLSVSNSKNFAETEPPHCRRVLWFYNYKIFMKKYWYVNELPS
jgi:hypothetical protein